MERGAANRASVSRPQAVKSVHADVERQSTFRTRKSVREIDGRVGAGLGDRVRGARVESTSSEVGGTGESKGAGDKAGWRQFVAGLHVE